MTGTPEPTDPPRKLSLADLISEPAAGPSPGGPASTIADQAIDWDAQIRTAKRTIEEPRVLRISPMTNHIVDGLREKNRRLNATEAAEQRTVAALESMLAEVQASKADNARMLWWARAAGIAGIVAAVLTVAVPIVQAYWPKAAP